MTASLAPLPFQGWQSGFLFFSFFSVFLFKNCVCELRELKHLIAHTMQTFTVKSAAAKSEIEKPHFWILCKGMNSGKPLSLSCPNSFRVEAETEEVKELLYWVSFALWRSKAFHQHLIGSVIPFIRIRDYQNLVLEKPCFKTLGVKHAQNYFKRKRFQNKHFRK
jgi:hypothetical protein